MDLNNVNNVFVPEQTDEELYDMYLAVEKSKLVDMILENFKFLPSEKLKHQLCSDKISLASLSKLMMSIHRVRKLVNTGAHFTTLVGDKQSPSPNISVSNLQYLPEVTTTQACIPYQFCPKCHGQGVVPYAPGWPLIPGLSIPQDKLSYTCDVCQGQKIIPMYIIPQEDKLPCKE